MAEETAVASQLFSGQFLVRLKLLEERRKSSDPKQVAAIDKALADPNFINDLTNSAMKEAGVSALPSGLGQLLQWLLANLPQILALIATLFGGA